MERTGIEAARREIERHKMCLKDKLDLTKETKRDRERETGDGRQIIGACANTDTRREKELQT